MTELKVGAIMRGGPWDKRHESICRVYMADGLAPTVTAGGGGGVEPKVILFEDDFIPGDIVTVKGYEELGPTEIKYIDWTERDYPYYIAWHGDDAEYDGYFEHSQLIKYENEPKGSDKLTNLNEVFEGKPINYVSLFSGIGGFEQALNKLGGTCVMASEIDKYANQAYEVLYGHKTVGDVTKVAAEDVPDHDLLVGGFPCQAFSVAGKRLGFEEARGTLFFEIARIAKVKQPKAMLLENVKGIVGHDGGKTLDTIIQTLDEIGYTVDFEVMNSKYFGVPQNRERIFIVAVRNDLIEPSAWDVGKRSDVVAKGKKRIAQLGDDNRKVKTFNFDWPAQEEVSVRLRDILESDVDEKFYLSEEKTAKLVTQLENGLAIKEATKQGYAVATEGDAVNFQFPDSKTRRGRIGKQMANTLEASGINQGVVEPQIVDEVRACLTPDREEKRQNGRRFKENDEPAFTLNTQDRHGVALAVRSVGNTNPSGNGMNGQVYDIDAGLSPTLTTNKGEGPKVADLPRYRIRKLTPRECFRLQGFPDAEFDKLTANGISNSQLYKMAGNAVTVNVIDAIGKRLLPYIGE